MPARWIPIEGDHKLVTYYHCTKDKPWHPTKSKRASHPEAKPEKPLERGSNWFYCPNCQTRFQVVLIKVGG